MKKGFFKILAMTTLRRTFGESSSTEYAVFLAELSPVRDAVTGEVIHEGGRLPLALSHNMLEQAGIPQGLFDHLVGSEIIPQDYVDSRDGQGGQTVNPLDRAIGVLDNVPGVGKLVVITGISGTVQKSPDLLEYLANFEANVTAQVRINKAKQQRLDRMAQNQKRLANINPDLKKELEEPKDQPENEEDPNFESQFEPEVEGGAPNFEGKPDTKGGAAPGAKKSGK